MNLYSSILRPALFRLDPEAAHDFALHSLQAAGCFPPALRASFGRPPRLPVEAFGVHFPNPVGLAAGMDKNAVALSAWEALGFGFAEVGTITARAQPGNPKPRLFRYPELGALINRFGFNNDGADVIAARLTNLKVSGRWPRIPVGINIGKSKVIELEDAAADYLHSYQRLLPFGDYFVVNVSSPNTPGLRQLQDKDSLAGILGTLRDFDDSKPLFVKIAPDLTDPQLDDILDLVESEDVTGLVATNTTIDHTAIAKGRDETGGLSGPPLRRRSADVLRHLRAGTKRPIIASGGISEGVDGSDRIDSGATLVQIYTGFVYRGPQLIREICNAIANSPIQLS